MTDLVSKWIAGVGATLSAAAVLGIFAMWSAINQMRAERPLRDQLRAVELEQIRQGITINSQELDVMSMRLTAIEGRIRDLEE